MMEEITLDHFRPQLVSKIMDGELGELGCLVIDRTVGTSSSGGGIRLAPGLTETEVAQLARSMTLKFGFLNFPTGGAKAGITAPPEIIENRRRDVMAAFGKNLGILIRKGVYFFGGDLGTTLDDINTIQGALGLPLHTSDAESMVCTAQTVLESARQCARHEGLELAGLTVGIEGFGNVGSELASMLSELGAHVVAFSTDRGAVHCAGGLDVAELAALRARHGSDLVHHCPAARRIELEELLFLDVDLLVPCARTWTIHADNADRVRARMIVPAANAPLTPAAETRVAAKGVLYLPGFVANCGAVLRSRMRAQGFDETEVRQVIEGAFAERVRRLLEESREREITPAELARNIAWRNFHALQDAASAARKENREEPYLARLGRRGLRSLHRKLFRRISGGAPAITRAGRKAALARFTESLFG